MFPKTKTRRTLLGDWGIRFDSKLREFSILAHAYLQVGVLLRLDDRVDLDRLSDALES
jgi:hypothetical protein